MEGALHGAKRLYIIERFVLIKRSKEHFLEKIIIAVRVRRKDQYKIGEE